MPGMPVRRARKERSLAYHPMPDLVHDPHGAVSRAVESAGQGGDYPPHDDNRAPTSARTLDHRKRLMRFADDCLAKLAVRPDRDLSSVYKDTMYLLMKMESQDKDPTPRPEDVRRGVIDMLAMLPDLCTNDHELRTLAVDALARVIEQTEP